MNLMAPDEFQIWTRAELARIDQLHADAERKRQSPAGSPPASRSLNISEGRMEYRIHWHACPHIHHQGKVMFVDATSVEAARAVAKDHIERHHGVEWFTFKSVEPYQRPTEGRVLEG